MKHVREQLPDVQRLRPGVSAATRRRRRAGHRQGPGQRYPDADGDGRGPRAGAGARGLALGAGHRRGDLGAADAAGRGTRARAVAGPPPDVADRSRWRRWSSCWSRARCWRPFGLTHRGAGQPPPAAIGQRPAGGHLGPERRPRLQPVRHRARKPRPGRQRRRRRPQHDVEHRAVLLGHAPEARRGRARALPRRRPGAARPGRVEVQTPTPGFPMQVYVANHINLDYPFGSSVPLSARGWQGPVASTRPSWPAANGSRSTSAGPPTATTCCGSRRLPPGHQSASIAEVSLFR